MGWCDPCAAEPLSNNELRNLGVFWLPDLGQPVTPQGRPLPPVRARPQEVFVTRLHVRYDNAHFPEDLVFQETADRANFQGRYVLRHEWTGEGTCDAAARYRESLPERREREAQTLTTLTGWNINEIRKQNGAAPSADGSTPLKWWQRIWKDYGGFFVVSRAVW
jgi:hypothetical protein